MDLTYLSSIHHDGSPRHVRFQGDYTLRTGDEVTLRLRTAVDAPVERLLLRICPDGEQFFAEMKPASAQMNPACRWWAFRSGKQSFRKDRLYEATFPLRGICPIQNGHRGIPNCLVRRTSI